MFRKKPRAEKKIPHDQVIAIVSIRFMHEFRVMPAMKFRAAHEIIQWTVTNIDNVVPISDDEKQKARIESLQQPAPADWSESIPMIIQL